MAADRDIVVARVGDLLHRFGLELAFVDPVSENGTEGVAGLLAGIEDALGDADDVPEPLVMAMIAIRRWIDDRIAADRRLTAETILLLREWQPWMLAEVTAWGHGRPCAPVPAAWSRAPRPSIWPAMPEDPAGPAGDAAAATVAVPAEPRVEEPPKRARAPASDDEAAIPVGVLPDSHDPEMLQLFCAEAKDLLGEIERQVLVVERDPTDPAAIDALFRAFHTLKGNVGVVKLVTLQQFTHEMESLLDAARKGSLVLGRDAVGTILAAADVVGRFVDEMAAQLSGVGVGNLLPLPIPGLVAAAHAILAGEPAPTPVGGAALPAAESAAESRPVAAPPAPPPTPAAPPAPPAPPSPAPPAAARAAAAVVRVDTHKLDGLVDLVGELVIAQSLVVQNPAVTSIADQNFARSLAQLRGITTDLQRTAMSLRMVAVRPTFQKMQRLVRDLAVSQGKEIRLVLEGEDTELDRGLVEDLADPLVHMIRNCVDHGVEPPSDRVAAGKPREGTIGLRAFHRGSFIVIEVSDDGRGLDPDRILAKAMERGLVPADARLDPAEILGLVFAPGFSTAERVTDISGRGVGMDVVRRNVERLRGKIDIDSRPGAGSRFTISLPLTLAIIEGVLVGVGGQRYVIPTLSVRESFRPRPGQVCTVQGKGEVVNVRGRLTPLLRLGEHLGLAPRAVDAVDGIVVVVESGIDARCILVDDLLGKQEVVIKSLGDLFGSRREFAGAAILGDGRVGLILDVMNLVKPSKRGGEAA